MKVISIALLMAAVSAVNIQGLPANTLDVQLKSRSHSIIQANNQLFSKLHSKIALVQKAAEAGDDKGASLAADQMADVVDTVQQRWLGSIDKEEPEIVDEFLNKMKDAVAEVHATEGFPKGKVAHARSNEDDWLTKVVDQNKKMQAMIPKDSKEDRVAVHDS